EAADAFTDLSESNADPAVRRQRELFGEHLALRSSPETRPAREVTAERNRQMIGRSDESSDVGCYAFHRPEEHIAGWCIEHGARCPDDVCHMPAIELVSECRARVPNVDR